MLNLAELNRLKGKRMRERSNEEDTAQKDQITAHLEYRYHPGNAEADLGAPNKAGRPHPTDLEDRVAKCHRYGRNICVKILDGWGKKCRSYFIFIQFKS